MCTHIPIYTYIYIYKGKIQRSDSENSPSPSHHYSFHTLLNFSHWINSIQSISRLSQYWSTVDVRLSQIHHFAIPIPDSWVMGIHKYPQSLVDSIAPKIVNQPCNNHHFSMVVSLSFPSKSHLPCLGFAGSPRDLFKPAWHYFWANENNSLIYGEVVVRLL